MGCSRVDDNVAGGSTGEEETVLDGDVSKESMTRDGDGVTLRGGDVGGCRRRSRGVRRNFANVHGLAEVGNLRVAAILGCMTSSVMVLTVGILVIWILFLLVSRSSLVASGSHQSHVFHIRGVSPSPLSPDGVDDGGRVLVVRKIVGLDEGIVRTGKRHEDGKGKLLIVHLGSGGHNGGVGGLELGDMPSWVFSLNQIRPPDYPQELSLPGPACSGVGVNEVGEEDV
jgi:hypothetical protein